MAAKRRQLTLNTKRIILRSWFYFRQGYATYLSPPFAFIGLVSSIYYLAIKSTPFFADLFPHFYEFIVFCIFTIAPASIFVAWMHYKKALSGFFKAEVDIQVEANPYSMTIVSPVSLPGMRVVSALGKLHGIDTTDLDKIVAETEKKFGLGQETNA